jgi:23S rRNA (guanosine2251-2'-O)-methyltransferase
MKIFGRNPVLEALVAQSKIKKIYLNQDAVVDEKLQRILDLAEEQGINVAYKTKRFINKLAENPMHQGVLAIKEDVKEVTLSEFLKSAQEGTQEGSHGSPFLLYIRDAYNEFNVGAIIRSAEASGVQAVIIPPKMEITANMIRSAMGATEHITIIHESLFQTIKQIKPLGYKVVGIELSGKDFYYNCDLTGAIMLIVGGEDKSLSTELEKKADFFVKIPMQGRVNSLNMSVAASIVLFDKLRQEIVLKTKK